MADFGVEAERFEVLCKHFFGAGFAYLVDHRAGLQLGEFGVRPEYKAVELVGEDGEVWGPFRVGLAALGEDDGCQCLCCVSQ